MPSEAKKLNPITEIKILQEPIESEIEDYALMHMVNNVGEHLEARAKDKKMNVDSHVLLIPNNKVYNYHSQFPLKASFLHGTWFDLMNVYKQDVDQPAFLRFRKIVDAIEASGSFKDDIHDNFFDFARELVIPDVESIMERVIVNLKDVLVENGMTVGEIDINKNSFWISW